MIVSPVILVLLVSAKLKVKALPIFLQSMIVDAAILGLSGLAPRTTIRFPLRFKL